MIQQWSTIDVRIAVQKPYGSPIIASCIIHSYTGWWFGTFFYFPKYIYIWDNPSHWLLYFSGRSKPPTSITIINNHILGIIIPSDFHFFRGVGIPPTSYQLTIYIYFFHPSPVVFGVFDRRGFFHATDQVLGTKRNGFSVSLARSEKISSCRGGCLKLWGWVKLLVKLLHITGKKTIQIKRTLTWGTLG